MRNLPELKNELNTMSSDLREMSNWLARQTEELNRLSGKYEEIEKILKMNEVLINMKIAFSNHEKELQKISDELLAIEENEADLDEVTVSSLYQTAVNVIAKTQKEIEDFSNCLNLFLKMIDKIKFIVGDLDPEISDDEFSDDEFSVEEEISDLDDLQKEYVFEQPVLTTTERLTAPVGYAAMFQRPITPPALAHELVIANDIISPTRV